MTDTTTTDTNEPTLPLLLAWWSWLIAVTVQATVTYWVFASGGGTRALLMPVSWLVLGAWLGRSVLRRLVRWHPVYDTLENVTNIKLRLLITWPISYPGLYLRILLDRYL